jgi:RND family efflux transporter MFP subunit
MGGYRYGLWHAKPSEAKRQPLYWVDPMHPWYKSDKPGIAPDCGMQLVPVYPGDEGRYQTKSGLPPGTVEVSPENQQLIGVEYGKAAYETLSDPIRAAARVTLDETRVAKVQSRIDGWIDRVYADFLGKQVKKGDPLLTVYSPEALATEQEYLLAAKAHALMSHGAMPQMVTGAENLVAAARRRLELWDIAGQEIDEMARTGEPIKNLTLHSPAAGFVTERNAFPGQRITPETALYTVADLSTVWVVADVFEYEAGGVQVGQPAEFASQAMPGRTFKGRVNYILPQVDPATRTLKVRIELANPGFELKPDMYGEVRLDSSAGRRLVVPESAVLDSGDRQTVFVDRGSGYLEPRPVRVGTRAGGRVEILSGLRAGERIVTSGNFLLDSESQLKSAGSAK